MWSVPRNNNKKNNGYEQSDVFKTVAGKRPEDQGDVDE